MYMWGQHPNGKASVGGHSMEAVVRRTGEKSLCDLGSALNEDSQPPPSLLYLTLMAA